MPTWNPDQYLKFAEERARPCRDLIAQIQVTRAGEGNVRRIIDLGCGPGNSTQHLSARWPDAEITGLDSSEEMIEAARRNHPGMRWETGDIAEWAAGTGGEPFDVVFSNSAMQWVADHGAVCPRLLARVAPGGALAAQLPANFDAPPHRLMRELAASPGWRHRFPEGSVREWYTHNLDFYHDALADHASRLDIWATEYVHILPGAAAIVEFYKGTGLRPFLDVLEDAVLEDANERARFLADYLALLEPFYPPGRGGKVLFPFRRLFLVAYR